MDAIRWSCDFQRRMGRGNSGAHCDRFYGMMPKFMRGHKELHVLNVTTVQPTCFESLVVGMAMYSDDCLEGSHGKRQDVWSLCNIAQQRLFWDFRNYMLTNAGVSFDPPTKLKITITRRLDGRVLHNLDNLITSIQNTYQSNDIEIAVVKWHMLSLKEQLDLIRTTTVHITPPGGVSYISIFLPRWATSIRLYSRDFNNDYHITNFLGYIAPEHVDGKGGRIPIEETMKHVAHSLERFDSFGCINVVN